VDRATLERERDDLTARIEAAEARISEIDGIFARAGYFDTGTPDEIGRLKAERERGRQDIDALMEEWERMEVELAERANS
jgi:hypothetical protein